jgi:DNA-binding GntR family transcriptional regulator
MARARDEEVYATLKDEITHFRVKPGDRLLEAALSARFGTSRTPVREALQRLEHEGLVVSMPGGRVARPFDLREFHDMYQLRVGLERLAVEQACERAIDAAILALKESAAEAFDGGEGDERRNRFLLAEVRVHMGIARLSQNEMLIATLERINDRISVLRSTEFLDPERVATTRRQHDEILDAIATRDAARGADLMQTHIEEAQTNISRLVSGALSQAFLRDGAAWA